MTRSTDLQKHWHEHFEAVVRTEEELLAILSTEMGLRRGLAVEFEHGLRLVIDRINLLYHRAMHYTQAHAVILRGPTAPPHLILQGPKITRKLKVHARRETTSANTSYDWKIIGKIEDAKLSGPCYQWNNAPIVPVSADA